MPTQFIHPKEGTIHSSEGGVYQDINTKIKKGESKKVIYNNKKQNHIDRFGHVTPALSKNIFSPAANIFNCN